MCDETPKPRKFNVPVPADSFDKARFKGMLSDARTVDPRCLPLTPSINKDLNTPQPLPTVDPKGCFQIAESSRKELTNQKESIIHIATPVQPHPIPRKTNNDAIHSLHHIEENKVIQQTQYIEAEEELVEIRKRELSLSTEYDVLSDMSKYNDSNYIIDMSAQKPVICGTPFKNENKIYNGMKFNTTSKAYIKETNYSIPKHSKDDASITSGQVAAQLCQKILEQKQNTNENIS